MADDLAQFLAVRGSTADRPLLGLTILLIEDSRFASEAMRLLCQRSGARLRRADCLRSARRHLAAYRPNVVIVDLGLPDGSGLDLIAELAAQQPRVAALLATSGSEEAETAALATGADAFLPKPLESLSAFHRVIADALPGTPRPGARQPGLAGEDRVRPDPMALRDDLAHAANLVGDATGSGLGYVAQFLSGVALTAHDAPLRAAAEALARGDGADAAPLDRIGGLLRDRLQGGAAL